MTISSFSQTILRDDSCVVISPKELKQINLIFLEHSKLLKTDSIMKLQIADYKSALSNCDSIQHIQDECLSDCFKEIELLNDKVLKYKDDNKKLTKVVGGISIITVISLLFNLF